MRRALVVIGVLVLVSAGALVAAGAGGSPSGKRYRIVFDNAFGLVHDADFKVGGVAVGSVTGLDVQRSDDRALVTVTVKRSTGFGGLRSDATCRVAPQSLIGEYFVDCQPGTRGRLLGDGGVVPVAQTESPIPADLVVNIMRLPYRERFSIILGELGAGLAARGGDLNATIRRALPAIGATDRTLRILADQRHTLQALARDSGTVLSQLGARRRDIGRFITTAKDTAVASAERQAAIAETFRRFPGFLDQLQPTMADLGTAARLQAPALADLRAAAPSVTSLLGTLQPFSRALEPSLTTLGSAAQRGRTAIKQASTLVQLLRGLGQTAPEAANNAAIVLNDLDDRSRAVEKDPRSPGGLGYTGLEAPLQYVFDQSLGANIFDQRGYSLKIDLTADDCANYTTADDAKADMARYKRCAQGLGPNQPGITTPDPSPPATAASARRRARTRAASGPAATATPAPPGAQGAPAPTPTATPGLLPKLPALPQVLQQLPQQVDGATQDLLDYLLGS
jgi:ABC-type transporter Mla subunit MlaD